MAPETLQIIWFVLIAVMFTAYFVLDGHNFGTGMIFPILADDDRERRQILATILPLWDGNQVWVIFAGASIFAAFPEWYASLFSGYGFYLALLLILVVLIVRVCAFKYRDKVISARWKRGWDRALMAGSYGPALLWGIAFANIVRGVVINDEKYVETGLLGLLNPYGLLGGLTFVLVFMLHGASWTALRTAGPVRERARRFGMRVAPFTIVDGAAYLVWTQVAMGGTAWTWVPLVLAAVALVLAAVWLRTAREVASFAATSVAIVATTAVLFGSLFPYLLPAVNDPANSLTIYNASSTPYVLAVMGVAVILFVPVVLAYQAWAYWVFRHRVTPENVEAQPAGLIPRVRAKYRESMS